MWGKGANMTDAREVKMEMKIMYSGCLSAANQLETGVGVEFGEEN